MKKQISIFGLALVSGLMSACGGGGGSSSDSPTVTTPPNVPTESISLSFQRSLSRLKIRIL